MQQIGHPGSGESRSHLNGLQQGIVGNMRVQFMTGDEQLDVFRHG